MKEVTIKKTVYSFDDVVNDVNGIKDKVLDKHRLINLEHDWWDAVYEDASNVHVEISSFDIDRGQDIEIDFKYDSNAVASRIMQCHGVNCETYKLAKNFLSDYEEVQVRYDEFSDLYSSGEIGVPEEDDEYERQMTKLYWNMDEAEQDMERLEDDFKHELAQEYLSMLRKEYEYLHSEEAILETLQANEYEFEEDGSIFWVSPKN